jgi:glycosyltransferase involved in cell wall biosynthesis
VKLVWSVPVRGAAAARTRGDLVRQRALVSALREDGHRVAVIESDGAAGARVGVAAYRNVVRRIVPNPMAVVMRDMGRIVHGVVHGRRLAAFAISENADAIVETQVHFSASGAVAARLTGLPLILDDGSPSREELMLGSRLPGLARRVLLHQMRFACALTVSSSSLRSALVNEGMPAEKVHVVPNGVSLSLHEVTTRREGRRRLRLGVNEVVVAFVGSFQAWHSVDLLIEAMRCQDRPDLHLLLIGEGPGRIQVLERLASCGLDARVTAPGGLTGPALAQALAAADIGVLPGSNDYGQPMKLLDYAAAGLAIVAPDLAPVRELVEVGRSALLFAPGKRDALVHALNQLVDHPDLRACLGREARRSVAAPAAWGFRARALLELLTEGTAATVVPEEDVSSVAEVGG